MFKFLFRILKQKKLKNRETINSRQLTGITNNIEYIMEHAANQQGFANGFKIKLNDC